MRSTVFLLYFFTLSLVAGCSGGGAEDEGYKLVGWGIQSANIVPPESVDASSDLIAVQDEISTTFNATLRSLSAEADPMQSTIDSMRSDSDILGIEVSNDTVRIYDRMGGRMNIPLFRRAGSRLKQQSEESLQKQSNLDTLRTARALHATGKKALVFSAYSAELGSTRTCNIAKSLEDMGYVVDLIADINLCGRGGKPFNDNTIQYLERLSEYQVIYMDTHGGVDEIYTAIPVNKTDQRSVNFQRLAGVESSSSFSDGGPRHFVLKSEFFEKNGAFSESVLHIDACNTGKDSSTFSQKFLNNGGAVFISYDDYTNNDMSSGFSAPFYQRLANENFTITDAIYRTPALETSWEFIASDVYYLSHGDFMVSFTNPFDPYFVLGQLTPSVVMNFAPGYNADNVVLNGTVIGAPQPPVDEGESNISIDSISVTELTPLRSNEISIRGTGLKQDLNIYLQETVLVGTFDTFPKIIDCEMLNFSTVQVTVSCNPDYYYETELVVETSQSRKLFSKKLNIRSTSGRATWFEDYPPMSSNTNILEKLRNVETDEFGLRPGWYCSATPSKDDPFNPYEFAFTFMGADQVAGNLKATRDGIIVSFGGIFTAQALSNSSIRINSVPVNPEYDVQDEVWSNIVFIPAGTFADGAFGSTTKTYYFSPIQIVGRSSIRGEFRCSYALDNLSDQRCVFDC